MQRQAEIARFTPEERNEYVASKKDYWDNYSIVTTSYNKGLAKGRIDTAKKMMEKGYPLEDISDVTGLTIEEIRSL